MGGNAKLAGSAYLVSIMYVVVIGAILFVSAGSLKYWQAWIYCSMMLVQMLLQTAYFLRKTPEFIARRGQRERETAQRVILNLLLVLQFIGYLVAGLDRRHLWSAVPVWVVLAANVIVFVGYVFVFFVYKENSYASSAIQVEQGQQVITTGPYRMVRHPMYLGTLVSVTFVAPALGSFWALIPFLLDIPMIVLRILNEEKLLLRDLRGYGHYCVKTRYHLVPWVW